MQTGGPQATIGELVALIVVTMALLTVAGWLGVGHHTPPSTGAAIAPRTSPAASPASSEKAAVSRSPRKPCKRLVANCRVGS